MSGLLLDEATVLRLERHEALAHAVGRDREVRDLGDALLLHDRRDPDPFWNRLASIRLPVAADAFDARLAELVTLFGTLGRRPHVWASPGYHRPDDLERRLVDHGFVDLGRGLLMLLTDRAPALARVRRPPTDPRLSVERIGHPDPARARALASEVALVSAEAFDADPTALDSIADEVLATFAVEGFAAYLARLDGEPVALAKRTTFDGASYLSAIGTRPAWRGRGLAGIVTAAAVEDSVAAGIGLTYLGVFEDNRPARRVYERLGFEAVGPAGGDFLLL